MYTKPVKMVACRTGYCTVCDREYDLPESEWQWFRADDLDFGEDAIEKARLNKPHDECMEGLMD